MMASEDDDSIEIIDDSEATASAYVEPWRLLVVDDDPTVHDVTRVVLADFEFEGRRLAILDAYSAAEAREMLRHKPWPSAMLLDVVMESDDAGLRLVEEVREMQGNNLTRIVLRTGQPGQAPERSVVVRYDLNDYKSKTELTAERMFVTLCTALRTHRQIAEVAESKAALETVVAGMAALQTADKPSRFGRRTLRFVARLFGVDGAGVFCVRPPAEHDGDHPHSTIVAGTHAYAELKARALNGLANDKLRERLRAAIAAPGRLFADDFVALSFTTQGGRVLAIVLEGAVAPSQAQLRALDMFDVYVAAAFDNLMNVSQIARSAELLEQTVAARTAELAHVNEALKRLAATDALTGALNRRAFLERAAAELARANRAARSVALLALDIDFFKAVNDRYGHPGGDAVLKAFAATLKRETRSSDIVARLGGEEFAVLLPETGGELAFKIAERIRLAVAARAAEFGEAAISVTVSIGLAQTSPTIATMDALIAAADAALYEAKRSGRNRTVAAP
jgi:two-component system, cell cycle response regulator